MSSLLNRRIARRPSLQDKIQELAHDLHPLVQYDTGHYHPDFPNSLLQYWLLTEDQLDSLAHFFHQRTPCPWTLCYPCPVFYTRGMSLEVKRRKIGKFIGLRDCETPQPVDKKMMFLDPEPYVPREALPLPSGPTKLGLFTPALYTRAPGCKGHCTWDPCMMRQTPSVYCMACGAAASQPSRQPLRRRRHKHHKRKQDCKQDRKRALGCESNETHEEEEPLRKQPRPLDIDEVIEEARWARMTANSGEEAMRRKIWWCLGY